MLSFKDISESPEELKSLLLCVLVIPYWYVAIHYFNFDFFLENSITTIIAYSIFITFTSTFLVSVIISVKELRKNNPFNLELIFVSVMIQIGVISSILLIGFISNFKQLYHFDKFMQFIFSKILYLISGDSLGYFQQVF